MAADLPASPEQKARVPVDYSPLRGNEAHGEAITRSAAEVREVSDGEWKSYGEEGDDDHLISLAVNKEIAKTPRSLRKENVWFPLIVVGPSGAILFGLVALVVFGPGWWVGVGTILGILFVLWLAWYGRGRRFLFLVLHAAVIACAVTAYVCVEEATRKQGAAYWNHLHLYLEQTRLEIDPPNGGNPHAEASQTELTRLREENRYWAHRRDVSWWASVAVYLLSLVLLAAWRTAGAAVSFAACLVLAWLSFMSWGILF
jgi:Flp pilus assembly protein TadB